MATLDRKRGGVQGFTSGKLCGAGGGKVSGILVADEWFVKRWERRDSDS